MVDIIGVKAGRFCLLGSQVPGELVNHGADDLQMSQLLGADVRQEAAHFLTGHGISLGQIPHGCRQLPVGAAKLA